MPQIIRQIPRAEPADPIEAPDAPPADPPEPFFWTKPSETDRGRLRPISALIRDTFWFSVRNLRSALVVALPAVAALAILSLVYGWALRPLFDDTVDGDIQLRFLLASPVSLVVGAIGFYLFTTALANLVVQSESGDTVAPGAALRLAARRLPRVITVNLIYGLLVFAVFAAPVFFLQLYLFERDRGALTVWLYLTAGIVAYAAPQINVYFTAIKIEERRPRFRQARRLVRGQRAAVLGRVLLWQIVRVASTAAWAIVAVDLGSLGWFCFSVVLAVVNDTILTTAFTLLYADLAGISASKAVMETGVTRSEEMGAGNNAPISRSA
ncbi:hypothetical protein [Candidatus Poriferisodalis sp.]|uniref:hypothetical protein n=1 Tax=Candidatus Poriferisodalis sp. TaxID=3101277 RepID=UPI003B02CFAE